MKNIFSQWKKAEIWMLVVCTIILIPCSIYTKSSLLYILCSWLGILAAIGNAQGKFYSAVVTIVSMCMYIYISYRNRYMGEVVSKLVFTMPVLIMTAINWNKNQDGTNTVKVYIMTAKDWLKLACICLTASCALYFTLHSFETEALIFSTINVSVTFAADYLLARRSKYGFLMFLVSDGVGVAMWSLPFLRGDWTPLPLVLSSLSYFVIDTYAYICWLKRERELEQE